LNNLSIAGGCQRNTSRRNAIQFRLYSPSSGEALARQTEMMDNENLMARARALDEEALAAIHDQFYPTVYRYVRYRLNDEQLAEDISAEVFLRFLDALNRRNVEIRDLKAWLLGTTSNLIFDHLRKKYRRPQEDIEDLEFLPGLDNPAATAEHHDQNHQVRSAMRNLTPDQQQVLSLRFLLECSIEETARIMRKSEGAIKVLQFRALATLRKLLEENQKS
jgi:RNA polymerase sigma-70 factor (ECF subfamily)